MGLNESKDNSFDSAKEVTETEPDQNATFNRQSGNIKGWDMNTTKRETQQVFAKVHTKESNMGSVLGSIADTEKQ